MTGEGGLEPPPRASKAPMLTITPLPRVMFVDLYSVRTLLLPARRIRLAVFVVADLVARLGLDDPLTVDHR